MPAYKNYNYRLLEDYEIIEWWFLFFFQDKDETAKEENNETPEIKENGVSEAEEAKTPDAEEEPAAGDQSNETTPIEKPSENVEKVVEETPENKKNKEKSKKKKWSFRSISFSKKDKSKPNKDADKNGDVKEVAEEVSCCIIFGNAKTKLFNLMHIDDDIHFCFR